MKTSMPERDCIFTKQEPSEIAQELMICREELCRLDSLVCELIAKLVLVSAPLEPAVEVNSTLPERQSPLGCDIQSRITTKIININTVLETQLRLLAI